MGQVWTNELLWTEVAAIAQVLVLTTIPLTIILYRRGERHSAAEALKQDKNKFYFQLDDMYMRILQMAVENPKLMRPSPNDTEDEQIRYDAFALIMWNFLESIDDFCRTDADLRKTWHPILLSESSTHADWFTRPENRNKFKREFRETIGKLQMRPPPDTAEHSG